MKSFMLVIENDEFADLLHRMLEQMQFVKVVSEELSITREQSVNNELLKLEKEPIWDVASIEKNYTFNMGAIIGQLDCEESAEELIGMLSV